MFYVSDSARNDSYSPKMARNAKCAYFFAMVLGRAWQEAEERQQQVKPARASPLAFSPIAGQPCRFSDSRKMRNAPFALLWHSVARGQQQEKYSPVSRVCES
jgi:hypothetical protein